MTNDWIICEITNFIYILINKITLNHFPWTILALNGFSNYNCEYFWELKIDFKYIVEIVKEPHFLLQCWLRTNFILTPMKSVHVEIQKNGKKISTQNIEIGLKQMSPLVRKTSKIFSHLLGQNLIKFEKRYKKFIG